jgi:CheY-like chemotaxis protein
MSPIFHLSKLKIRPVITLPKILLVGQDHRLLDTRAAVLRQTGANVTISGGAEARKVVLSENPDLVVLCHSLPVEDAESVADETRKCCPGAKVLLVLPAADPDRPYQDSKFDGITAAEPVRLVGRAKELLQAPFELCIKKIARVSQRVMAHE